MSRTDDANIQNRPDGIGTPQPRTGSVQVRIPKRSLYLVIVLLAIIGSFFLGEHYGHSKQTTSVPTASNSQAAGGSTNGDGFAGGRGNFRSDGAHGSVTAISSTSITVMDTTSNTSKTYTITSSTQITDNGSTVTTSDIQTGDTVLVTSGSSATTTATRILVNPSFGGQDGSSDSGAGSNSQSN